MIDYSISMYPNNLKPSAAPKAYARAQVRSVLELEDIAEHISSHNSKYNQGDVYAVLVEMVQCTREFLLDGNKVSFGKLGCFYPSIRSIGADSLADFTSGNITSLTVQWSKGPMFVDMKADAVFNFVPTRHDQGLLKKAVKAGETTVDLTDPNDDDTPVTPTPSANVTITAVANDAQMGSVTGGGSYVQGASVTLTATANEGYHFVQWSNGRTTASITITAESDVTLTATFAADNNGGGNGGGTGMDG